MRDFNVLHLRQIYCSIFYQFVSFCPPKHKPDAVEPEQFRFLTGKNLSPVPSGGDQGKERSNQVSRIVASKKGQSKPQIR